MLVVETTNIYISKVFYWSSSSLQRGIEILGVRVTCCSKHQLVLVPTTDGLVRRPRANWATVYMNCDLNDAEIWLKTLAASNEYKENEKENDDVSVFFYNNLFDYVTLLILMPPLRSLILR